MFTGVVNTDSSQQVGGNVSVLQQDGSGNLKVATASSTDVQRVSAQSGDFADGAIATLGTKADSAIINPALSATEIALLKGLVTLLTKGQQTSVNSLPVVPASDFVGNTQVYQSGPNRTLDLVYTTDTFADQKVGIMSFGKAGTTGASASAKPILLESDGTVHVLENNSAASKSDLDTIAAAQVAQGSSTSGQNGPLIQGAVTTSSPTYTNGQTSPISITPSGGVRVAQSGTWTMQPGNTPNTTAWLANPNTPYPSGATAQTGASGNVANATATATLTGVSAKTTYITGFEVTGSGATLGSPVTVTVTGTITGTLSYTYSAIAGVLLENNPLIVGFVPAIPSSAVNTSIVVSCPALGSGNTNNTVVAHGYTL